MSVHGLVELKSDELDRFFYRCVDDVAHELIGMFLFNRLENDLVGGQIIEAEAYCENDPAAHCYDDNRPHRRSPPQRWFDSMYLPGGHVYIFPMWCLNLVCGPKGFGSGVLIRALRPTCGLDVMRKRREKQRPAARTNDAYLCNGPENLCQAISITKGYDGQNLLDTTLRLFKQLSSTVRVKCGRRIKIPENNPAAKWSRGYILDDRRVVQFLTPEARRIGNRQDYPPAELVELKTNGPLLKCWCSRKGSGSRKSEQLHGSSAVERLTRELDAAREQQMAMSGILRAISQSKFDVRSILQSVAQSAARLCRSDGAVIFQLESGVYRFAAGYSLSPAYLEIERQTVISPGPETVIGRAAMSGKVARIDDALADPLYGKKEDAKVEGNRSIIGVPLMRDGEPVVVIGLGRRRIDPFHESEVELAATFAAQAVIAIENARLLNELRQRTSDLAEALEQQTATSDVLKVISSSPGDLEPVFATMLEKAVQICDATFGNIYRWDGEALQLVATHNTPPAYAEHRKHSPFRAEQDNAVARMIRGKAVVHVFDAAANEAYTLRRDPTVIAAVELGGIRSSLVVPMLKDEDLVGAFIVSRQEVRAFTDKQIALITNFAAQAVIAIENARLLTELRQRTGELERSYEVVRQQATQLETQAQQLEKRVNDQVGEIERMSRLRRFLPPQVADLIVAAGTEKQLESHRREITALFCDLRGFTGFTESADAEDVMALLRDYHAAIGEIVIKYSGTLERYAGDGVMVIFNDPVPVENPALQAVLMALEMRDAIGALTEKWRRLGHEIGFGIGIAHGFATLGTIGFEGRFDYAAIGTVSNVASRLCDEAKPGQILISPRVLMKVENAVKVEPVGEFELKGIRRPLAAYNVLAGAS